MTYKRTVEFCLRRALDCLSPHSGYLDQERTDANDGNFKKALHSFNFILLSFKGRGFSYDHPEDLKEGADFPLPEHLIPAMSYVLAEDMRHGFHVGDGEQTEKIKKAAEDGWKQISDYFSNRKEKEDEKEGKDIPF